MTARLLEANLAEKAALAIDTLPRKITEQVHEAMFQITLSPDSAAGSRSAVWTLRIHAGAL